MPMTVEEQREWFRSYPTVAVWCMTRPETTWGRTMLQEGALGRIATEECANLIGAEQLAEDASARAFDAIHVPNGDFTVQYSRSQHDYVGQFKFRIHLVQSGTLAGQRIIKQEVNGTYRGFGFITRDGSFSLWQRFHRDANAPYVEAAIYLIRGLAQINHENTSNTSIVFQCNDSRMSWDDEEGRSVAISAQHRCAMCNNLVGVNSLSVSDPVALCRTHQHVTVTPMPDYTVPAYDDNIRMPIVDRSNLLMCELGTGEVR